MSSLRCLPVLLAALLPVAAQAQAPQWTLAQSSGAVTLSIKGRSIAVQAGEAIPQDAALLTGRDGIAILSRGADRVTLSPNARLRFATGADISAERGRTSFALAGQGAVATPFLLARAENTSFSITVTPGGASIQPSEGAVDVSTLDGMAKRRLQPGMVALVGADQPDQIIIDGSARQIVRPKTASAPIVAMTATRTATGAIEIASTP